MEPAPDERPWMDRPIRSVLDIRIGTIVKAYLLYLLIGLVLFVIGAIVLFSVFNSKSKSLSGAPGSDVLSWSAGAGETVTPAEYSSVRNGALLGNVRARFGEPASQGPNPLDQVTGSNQTCLGYRSSVSEKTLLLFCFAGGRLVDKQRF